MDDSYSGAQVLWPVRTRLAVTAFARALEARDLGAIGGLLAPECVWTDGTLETTGAPQVLEHYRAATGWAERAFDEWRHECSVALMPGDLLMIIMTTYVMQAPNRWHRLEHMRKVGAGDGRLVRIIHACPAAAASAFEAFLREGGIAPPPPGFV